MATINDPVLGTCTVLPLRRGSLLFVAAAFLIMAIAGPIILAVWLLEPSANLDFRMILVGFLGTLTWFGLPNQVKSLLSPYYAIIGPNGFAAFGLEPILWRDVDSIKVRTYRGKPVGLAVVLTRPRKLSRTAWISNLFGLLNRTSAPYLFTLPKNPLPIPFEQLCPMFLGQLDAYRSGVTSQPAAPNPA